MGLDIRLPLGMLFTILGLILMLLGMLSDPALYAKSLGININFLWGVALLCFGAAMLALGARSTLRQRAADRPSCRPGQTSE